MTKYWFNLNKEKKVNEPIIGLVNKKNKLCRQTNDMANIAREHHKALQAEQTMTDNRRAAIEKLKELPKPEIPRKHYEDLEDKISDGEVERALKRTHNRKSPGTDGFIYEFWKQFPKPEDDDPPEVREEKPNIPEILTTVYNDIEEHGVEEKQFNEGLMFLLYKDGERVTVCISVQAILSSCSMIGVHASTLMEMRRGETTKQMVNTRTYKGICPCTPPGCSPH